MRNTLEVMSQRVLGLQTRLQDLREQERLFQRAAGLQVQIEKDRAATIDLHASHKAAKDKLQVLRNAKSQAVQSTAQAIGAKMGHFMPSGRAVFEIDDEGKSFLGWDIPGRGVVAYGGLSGGQRVIFESALAYALINDGRSNPVIIVEGAELGNEIGMLLKSMAAANPDAQIIACTCHHVPVVPDGWDAVRVE